MTRYKTSPQPLMSSAYLLVSHGSRDPRPQVALERLARLLLGSRERELTQLREKNCSPSLTTQRQLPQVRKPAHGTGSPSPLTTLIGTACLELSPTPLHQQISEFSDRAVSDGHQQVQIVPLFLLPGVHVMEDIPAEVKLARQAVGTKIELELLPHLGSHAGLVRLLQRQVEQTEAEKTILLAHGSRRADSEYPVEALAQQLDAVTAYWSVAPSLAERVQELAIAGRQRIAIAPYFLFAGGITDAIAQVVKQLQIKFPAIEMCLMEPLGATQELADLIWDLIET